MMGLWEIEQYSPWVVDFAIAKTFWNGTHYERYIYPYETLVWECTTDRLVRGQRNTLFDA